MVLNAQKQPGWTLAPTILLDGNNLAADGLVLSSSAAGSTIRGLAIRDFGGDGIEIQANSNNNIIAGNYIGRLTATGTDAGAGEENAGNGINVLGANSTIGGPTGADRNVISGNAAAGVAINGAVSTGNSIVGNHIGTDVTGTVAVGNTNEGIKVSSGASNNTIGGTVASARNVISGNLKEGINISGATTSGNVVQGNLIGTNEGGTAALGNGNSGVTLGGSASNNTIGGTTSNTGNTIAFNSGRGIQLNSGSTGNSLYENSIYSNTGLGIDLGNNGVTVNDGSKNSGLPNYDMDFPVFTSASLNGSTLTVTGYVGSAPGQATFANARVEIFTSDNDPSGYGEGRTYLGFLTTDGSGNISGSLTVSGIAGGDRITGTATDGSNNTSEFGANVIVVAPGYQPDAMIKLASEGVGAYAIDNVYETTAATQVKSQEVVSASTAIYNVLFQNDGTIPDNVAITQAAADNCAGYTVQYLDNTSTDRTAAVTGGGYTITGLAAGAGTTWTLRVTPAGTANGGSAGCGVSVTATSAGNGTKADQVRAVTASTSANLTLLKSADRATVAPGQEITYTVNASNGAGLTQASGVVVSDPIPAYTGIKVGSATFAPGTSTLSGTPAYSSDGGGSWTYSPASGGCAAPAGYDFCVTNVRWTTSGAMPPGTSFTVTFVVRVK
jgi:uncharacterized repeat protein (TIGR01451 family)